MSNKIDIFLIVITEVTLAKELKKEEREYGNMEYLKV